MTGKGERAQHGVKVRHQDRRRNSLSADIGNRKDDQAISCRQDVVVVSADSLGRHVDTRKLKT